MKVKTFINANKTELDQEVHAWLDEQGDAIECIDGEDFERTVDDTRWHVSLNWYRDKPTSKGAEVKSGPGVILASEEEMRDWRMS